MPRPPVACASTTSSTPGSLLRISAIRSSTPSCWYGDDVQRLVAVQDGEAQVGVRGEPVALVERLEVLARPRAATGSGGSRRSSATARARAPRRGSSPAARRATGSAGRATERGQPTSRAPRRRRGGTVRSGRPRSRSGRRSPPRRTSACTRARRAASSRPSGPRRSTVTPASRAGRISQPPGHGVTPPSIL